MAGTNSYQNIFRMVKLVDRETQALCHKQQGSTPEHVVQEVMVSMLRHCRQDARLLVQDNSKGCLATDDLASAGAL